MAKLTEEQKARKKQLDKETRDAKGTLHDFINADGFAKFKLPKDVIAAMTRLAVKPGSGVPGGGGPTMNDQLTELFGNGKVGTVLDELAVFKATKMGRRELKKKVREALQRSQKADRLWIAFDEKDEVWTYMGKGEKPPKKFPEASIPNFNVKDNPDYVAPKE